MPQDWKKRYNFSAWSLLFPLVVAVQQVKYNASQVPRNGFEVFTTGDANDKAPHFQRSGSNDDTDWARNSPAMVLWTYGPHYDPDNDTVNLGGSIAKLGEIISPASKVIRWISPTESLTECMGQMNSGGDMCVPMFYCLRSVELGFSNDSLSQEQQLSKCLEQRFNITQDEDEPAWQCLMGFGLFHSDHESDSCLEPTYDLTAENWRNSSSANTAWDPDANLQIALAGGVDGGGMYWEGRRSSETIAETIGRQFWGQPGVTCTIDSPCQTPTDCTKVGSFTAIGMGKSNQPAKLAWVFLVSSAFTNINRQLVNQYNELKDALGSLALDNFTGGDFQKTSQQSIPLGGLMGLSGIFAILGGFIPRGVPAIEATGTIASGAATFLSNSISSGNHSEATQSFSETVLSYYAELLSALEDLVAKLFAGDQIPGPGSGSFNITDMMKNGTWVDPKVLTRVSDLTGKMRTEILARTIDSLWKVPTSNKVWVIFNDLQDDMNHTKCDTDDTGPQDSKYCADGGVYYTYYFVEKKGGGGGVGWPQGADKLQSEYVTEASAKSYRLMKETGGDPFNFVQASGTAAFLLKAFTPGANELGDTDTDLSDLVGRYPGSWTLPVCDTSTWGTAWNWDYTRDDAQSREAYYTHPPCMCGAQALETYDWAKAAGMQSFQTFWSRCSQTLRSSDFTWPEGVTFVNYPAGDGEDPVTIWKP